MRPVSTVTCFDRAFRPCGNKRTAYVVCRTFLKLNGRDLVATQEEKFGAVLRLAEGLLSEPELVDWIREHLNKK